MEKELTIRVITNADSQAVIDLILPIQQQENNVPVTLEDQPDLKRIEAVYQGSGGGFWGIEDEGMMVATIALIDIGDGKGVIRKMFVKQEYRGRTLGLATRLLEHLIAYCKTAGITDLYLGTVHTLKAAIRFYERNDFTIVAKHELPPAFPIMEVDDVFCHLHLK
ncbi:GNAT family N-acetyltransferase [Taibaiella chishuiensis]|uniref:N-acetylglutamate synthase-like GNAT family acetyltransferase n=1 Tax=Taibaiella chishuiensis TaxID=1434707 RepID=A0A2P8CVV7_9BACT|nr:GNAT family N-acetyltransferase [Taibaiella chishuiensis]PSK89097.1 N-acetylglutamate synthase-like GNAT family acetyltransferase [Taibaiella chishuiensis]